MLNNYRIKRHFSTIYHSKDCVEFRFGVWNPLSYNVQDSTQSGKVAAIVKLLTGSHSTKEIAQETGASRVDIEALIDHLLSIGVVENSPTNALETYLDKIQMPFYRSESSIDKELPIILLGTDRLMEKVAAQMGSGMKYRGCSQEQWSILTNPDISWLDDGLKFQEKLDFFMDWKNHLVVVTMDMINPLAFKVINKILFELSCPWIHAALDGPFIFIGPTFIPGSTSCYACLEKRVLMNLREAESYIKYKKLLLSNDVDAGQIPVGKAIDGMLGVHTAFELMNLQASGNTFTRSKIMAIYLPTMEITYNEVLRVPGCPVCGSALEKDHFEMHFDMSKILS